MLLMDKDGLLTQYSSKIDNASVERALKTCAASMRTSPNGDMFAFDLKSLDFVFDPSLDCYVEGGKKMTIDSECTLHNQPKLCENVMNFMLNGRDSDTDMHHYWQFQKDGSKEYLEWVVLPDEDRGYDGSVRSGNGNPHQLILVQGTIEKELHARYKFHRVFIHLVGFISIVINLMLNHTDYIRSGGRRKYDYK
jgi:hypothetical protein